MENRRSVWDFAGYALAADWADGSGARRDSILRAENKKTPPDVSFVSCADFLPAALEI